MLVNKLDEKAGDEATYDVVTTAMLKAGKTKEAQSVFKMLASDDYYLDTDSEMTSFQKKCSWLNG